MSENKRITLKPDEFTELLKYRKSHKTIKDYADKSGNYQVWTNARDREFIDQLREVPIKLKVKDKQLERQINKLSEENDELKELLDLKSSLSNVEIYKLIPKSGDHDSATAVPLLSDYRDWETDRKSTRLNSSHSGESRMPSSA